MFRSVIRKAAAVPDVMALLGQHTHKLCYITHPGVMAVAKLLEMRYITRFRADLTQENIEAMKEFDEDLARQAQIAYNHGLQINFMELQYIDSPGFLDRLLKEKELLAEARKETYALPAGVYTQPKCLKDYVRVDMPLWERAKDYPEIADAIVNKTYKPHIAQLAEQAAAQKQIPKSA
eukprot:GDKI01008254.1.p1 GENE.GDKI01008254.1~~GDKI01008254.1.p1  ORF type:complete len:178 (+),score=54.77 GDKI01008254.1:29-562(+)